MKHGIAFLLFSVLLLSCKKEDDPKPPAPTANFTITGLKDVDMSSISGNVYSFPISVIPNSGKIDTVFLYASEMPPGVSVGFSPIDGITPFTSTVSVADFSSGGGVYTIKINAVGRLSGLHTYEIKLTSPQLRGWQLGTEVFHRESVEKNTGGPQPYIKARAAGNGAQLMLSFASGGNLPAANRSYSVTSNPTGPNMMSITLSHGAQIWEATGGTGNFTFNTEGKFTFKCSGVSMTNGNETRALSCSFSE